MPSNSVCDHTRDEQIGLLLRDRLILLSLVWLQTELDSTQSYYDNHYLSIKSICWIPTHCPLHLDQVFLQDLPQSPQA